MNQKTTQPFTNSSTCPSCGRTQMGKFCADCGEKRIEAQDWSLWHFGKTFWAGITNFDSQFVRSFWFLLFFPGWLTQKYWQGERVQYLKPIQVFLACNVIFFFFFPMISVFYASVDEMITGYKDPSNYNYSFYDFEKNLVQKAQKLKIAPNQLAQKIQVLANTTSKIWMFVLLPLWAIGVYAIFWRKNPYYVAHLAFVLHCFAFYLLLYTVYFEAIFRLVREAYVSDYEIMAMYLLYLGYIIGAVRRVYGLNIWKSTVYGFLSLVIYVFIFLWYRQAVTILCLEWI
ncbi:MAG: DUF3667 domain-containing protein [Microscillaceae bacterium]|jgi:hypothetical protein|nr:DUF3667 domain-containing protein [Microscillaceae bacterium]